MQPVIADPDVVGLVRPARLSDRQVADLEFMRQHVPASALWHEVGVGKTHPTAARVLEVVRPTVESLVPPPREGGYTIEERAKGLLAISRLTFGDGKTPRALVLMRRSILKSWKQKIASLILGYRDKHPEWADVTVGVLRGGAKPEQMWGRGYAGVPDIVLMNYDYVTSLCKLEKGKPVGWLAGLVETLGVLVCDEIQRLKGFRGFRSNHGVRARVVNALAPQVPIRIGLSGSPILKPESSDLWAIYHLLDPTIFGPTRWKFVNDFFYDRSKDYRYEQLVLKPGMAGEMSRRMYMIARRVTKKECPPGEFPEPRRKLYEVELPSSVRVMYDELEKTGITADKNGQITRLMLLDRLMALQQLASGFVIENGVPRLIDVSHKAEQLDDIIEQIDGKFVVWAHFRHEIEWLVKHMKEIGVEATHVYGGMRRGESDAAIHDFSIGNKRCLIGQPGTVGAGNDFQVAQHAIRFSRSYITEDFVQSDGRVNRSHSEFDETIHHEIVCAETKDEDVYRALINDVDLASTITLDHLLPVERNV